MSTEVRRVDDDPDLLVVTDGASRGNPGPSAAAFLIFDASGKEVYHEGKTLGPATNNRAEYQAILSGLREAQRRGGKRIQVFTDSELAVRQLNGDYKVKDPEILALFNSVQEAARVFESASFVHVPREHPWVARADALANRALDEEERQSR